MTTPIAVFASGRGSNLDAILAAVRSGKLDAEIVSVISDVESAPVLEKAKKQGLNARCIAWSKQTSGTITERRAEHEKRVLEALFERMPKFLVLAGYMRILTPHLIEAFRSERAYSRIVNVHPSLLPAFPGVGSYAQAFRHGVKLTGVTVHLVEAEVDSGPICAQEAFDISDCRSVQDVEKRGLEIEHRLYPETLQWILSENFSVKFLVDTHEKTKGRLCVRPN